MRFHPRRFTWLSVASLLAVTASPVAAYEFDTHEAMSAAAFQLSSLPSRLSAYGIRVGDPLPGRVRIFRWERLRPIEWVAQGGRDEDWPDVRVINHFYDPYNDRGFTGFGQFGYRAPDWALEDTREFPDQNHSYRDARAAFYLGLTDRDRATRERSLGYTFYALGHVMHLIQDMAQPQHARNDPHPTFSSRRSLLEAYVDELVNAGRFDPAGDVAPSAILGKIGRVRDLWATGTGTAMGRLGMAAFTNASFVSAGTNFNDLRGGATGGGYPDPKLDLLQISSPTPNAQCKDGVRPPLGFPLTFYGNRFSDPIQGGEIENDRMTTYSIFDQHLHAQNAGLIFALNCFNLDRVADILVRRAVSYSAALLDYFFRGRIEGRLEPPRNGEARAPLRIVNPASTPTAPGERLTGTFELYYDAADGIRVRQARWEDVDLTPGAQTDPLSIPDPPMDQPAPVDPARYLLVFRGKLGEESDAVTATQVDGRVWYLQLGSQTRDHGALVEYPPMVLEPGPILSGTLTPVDPAAVFDGTAYVVMAGAGRTATLEYVFTCGGPEFTPMGIQTPRGEGRSLMAWYRGPAAMRGDTAVLSVSGQDETLTVEGQGYVSSFSPVTIEVVRFAAPASPEALAAFTVLNPPVVQAVLSTVSVNAPSFVEVGPIDLQGAAFVGVRLTAVPTAPGPIVPSGVGGFLDNICFHEIVPRFGLVSLRIYGGSFGQGPQATITLRIQPAP